VVRGEFVKPNEAEKIVKIFFETKFAGIDRYKRRIKKLDK